MPFSAITPPALPGLAWGALAPSDAEALAELGAACLAADGGFRALPAAGYLSGAPSIAALGPGGQLLAFAAAHRDEPGAAIAGLVHPSVRGRGIGRFLMEWSVARAEALVAHAPADQSHALRIATEGLTPAADRLYTRFGFSQQFAEDVMRFDLAAPIPAAPLPGGLALREWSPELAGQFFAAYDAAFRTRPSFPGWSAEQWIEWATGDDDFAPKLSLLALDGDTPVGFVVAGTGWLVQVGVRPEWRGRGVAAALAAELLRRARAAGWDSVLLDVNVNNPGAARVYSRLGFAPIGRRARYLRD